MHSNLRTQAKSVVEGLFQVKVYKVEAFELLHLKSEVAFHLKLSHLDSDLSFCDAGFHIHVVEDHQFLNIDFVKLLVKLSHVAAQVRGL